MQMIRRFMPDRLWARFAILLFVSLVAANLIAALLIAREGTALDQVVRVERDAGRLAALVETLEEVDKNTGRTIMERSMTGYTRFTLEPQPIVSGDARILSDLVEIITPQLPGHDVRVSTSMPLAMDRGISPLVIVSVRLNEGAYHGMWLNSLVYPLTSSTAWTWKAGFFVPLIVSLIGSLVVGMLFIRHMTSPLRRIADAAVAAGQGNRLARLPECGALELRNVAHAFNDMQQKISEFEATRQRMLAAIGHDLRTPITSLRLRASLTSDDDLRPDMIRILDEMAVMSRDLVSYTRSSESSEPPVPTDLTALVAHICRDLGATLQNSAPITTLLRPVTFSRAISNIVANALRYAGDADVSLRLSAKDITISIKDTGPGIAEDLLPIITHPFVRGEGSRNTTTGGTGLGLAIAEQIIRDHGGRLTLQNRIDGGLAVLIVLPLCQPDVA